MIKQLKSRPLMKKTWDERLIDSRVTKIPHMFHHAKVNDNTETRPNDSKFNVPIIDLKDIDTKSSLHVEALDKIRRACKE